LAGDGIRRNIRKVELRRCYKRRASHSATFSRPHSTKKTPMSDSSSNPFILPGMGQSGDIAGNPLMGSMEMMQKAWTSLTGPGGLAQSLPMAAPSMNTEDLLERRISDLRSIENWLRINLSMLGSTIQGLDVQRATVATLRAFAGNASASSAGAPSPLDIALGLKPAAPGEEPAAASASLSMADAGAAPQAWWNMLQQQFNNLAAATAASMPTPQAPASTAPKACKAAASKPRATTTARKTAAKSSRKPSAKS
jgi:hypothetical protein